MISRCPLQLRCGIRHCLQIQISCGTLDCLLTCQSYQKWQSQACNPGPQAQNNSHWAWFWRAVPQERRPQASLRTSPTPMLAPPPTGEQRLSADGAVVPTGSSQKYRGGKPVSNPAPKLGLFKDTWGQHRTTEQVGRWEDVTPRREPPGATEC